MLIFSVCQKVWKHALNSLLYSRIVQSVYNQHTIMFLLLFLQLVKIKDSYLVKKQTIFCMKYSFPAFHIHHVHVVFFVLVLHYWWGGRLSTDTHQKLKSFLKFCKKYHLHTSKLFDIDRSRS